MHQSIAVAKSLDEGIADRRLIDNCPRQHVAENELLGVCSNLLYCFENAKRSEGLEGIGWHLNAGPNLGEVDSLLQDEDAFALARERQRRSSATDAAADHDKR